jgi:hypothetical protein
MNGVLKTCKSQKDMICMRHSTINDQIHIHFCTLLIKPATTSLCTVMSAGKSSVDVSDWSGYRVDFQLLCNVDEPAWAWLGPVERTCLNPMQEWQACKMTTTSNIATKMLQLSETPFPILSPESPLPLPDYLAVLQKSFHFCDQCQIQLTLSPWSNFASVPATNSWLVYFSPNQIGFINLKLARTFMRHSIVMLCVWVA